MILFNGEKLKKRFKDYFLDVQHFFDVVFFFILDVKHFLVNCWNFRQVLWYDRDWDFVFMLNLFKFKIQNMEAHLRKNGILINSEKYSNQMKKTHEAIQSYIEGDYFPEEEKALADKWGDLVINFEDVPNTKYSAAKFTHTLAKSDEEKERASNEWHQFFQKQDKEKQKDWNYIFNSMRKHGQHWWD